MKIVKAVLIGDGSVGKTCLVHRLTDDAFSFDYNPTVFDMTKHTLTVSHGSVTETVQIGKLEHSQILDQNCTYFKPTALQCVSRDEVEALKTAKICKNSTHYVEITSNKW